jgi:hypothetical protein
MTSLLLALTLCWGICLGVEPCVPPEGVWYRVQFAERHGADFAWVWHVTYEPRLVSPPCAEVPGSVCVYRFPQVVTDGGWESGVPMITNATMDWSGSCE